VSGGNNYVSDFTSHLANAFDLRRMQRVQLVLVGALLRADAFSALKPH
jgi:hypothetical protein